LAQHAQELQARIADIAEKKKYVGQQVPTPYVILARQVDILTKKKSPPIMVRTSTGSPFSFNS
jgi:hypothetical protein